ncbi:tRNA (N(6)-L-threonylcarbamoyladenosine(37)-C(2))-methylthiotransferase [Candidatus Woesearchaeota archaeon]|nr:tRNA (N(6)-L-threonylcarbamoyladenosine(37)-C(2))-methylthiotransferase [Candidatus Woesearchaeota archaeon]
MARCYLRTFGCSTNFSEGEIMQGLLAEAGIGQADAAETADVIVLNICTVKGDAVALRELRRLMDEHPQARYVIAGCVTEAIIPKARELAPDASFIDTHNISHIVEVVRSSLDGSPATALGHTTEVKLRMPRLRRNPMVGIIPIASGCMQGCSYCSVRLVKGGLMSYPEATIVAEARAALASGCAELWITSQDTANYWTDRGEGRLPSLLRRLCRLPDDFRIRVGMMNPTTLLPIADSLVESMAHPKVFRFLHLPVQSGSDTVLARMERRYTVAGFEDLVGLFRDRLPGLTLSTDIICGFPGETEEDFRASVDLVRRLRPEVLNISRFVPREGTQAAAMRMLPPSVARDRTRELTRVFGPIALATNRELVGREVTVLIDEEGKGGTRVGRTDGYRPVVVEGTHRPGSRVRVRIRRATCHDLRAF